MWPATRELRGQVREERSMRTQLSWINSLWEIFFFLWGGYAILSSLRRRRWMMLRGLINVVGFCFKTVIQSLIADMVQKNSVGIDRWIFVVFLWVIGRMSWLMIYVYYFKVYWVLFSFYGKLDYFTLPPIFLIVAEAFSSFVLSRVLSWAMTAFSFSAVEIAKGTQRNLWSEKKTCSSNLKPAAESSEYMHGLSFVGPVGLSTHWYQWYTLIKICFKSVNIFLYACTTIYYFIRILRNFSLKPSFQISAPPLRFVWSQEQHQYRRSILSFCYSIMLYVWLGWLCSYCKRNLRSEADKSC